MTEPMRILYDYASRYRLSGSMEDCEQHNENDKLAERSLKALQETLNEEERKQLEYYLSGQRTVQSIELEAMFCAGFSIALELSRL